MIKSHVKNRFKVISIINSNFLLEKSPDESEELLKFYEKTFDRKINVDVSIDKVKELLEIDDNSAIKSYLNLADSNIRVLIRAKKYFDLIDSFFKEKGKINYLNDIGTDYKKIF